MEVKRERFNNAADYMRQVNTRPVNEGWRNHERESRNGNDAERWSGAETWEEACEIAARGFAEAVGQVQAAAKATTAAIFERVDVRPVRPRAAYVGGSPNVVRAMQGIPRDMRAMERAPKKRNGLTLVYEISANCSISTQRMINAGARMVALVRLCERAQIPVRLIVSDTGRRGDAGYIACEVIVKDYHAPFNLQKLAYFLAHPSAHRRLFFSWLETTPLVREYVLGYGHPITNKRDECEIVRAEYAARGEKWYSMLDFQDDNDVIKAWNNLTDK